MNAVKPLAKPRWLTSRGPTSFCASSPPTSIERRRDSFPIVVVMGRVTKPSKATRFNAHMLKKLQACCHIGYNYNYNDSMHAQIKLSTRQSFLISTFSAKRPFLSRLFMRA